jgi:hypothetical protein
LKKEDFLSFSIFWQGNEPRNFVLQNPVTRQDSLGKFLCNALLFTLCLGTIFPKKTKLPSYYNRDKKEGSCTQ